MRILHINKFFDLRGGAETMLHALMAHQREEGHEVHAFSTRSPDNVPSQDATRFVERFDYSIQEGLRKDIRKGMSYLWNREARTAVSQALREIRPDVIHLHNIYHHLSSSILGPIRAFGIPCVQTLHDYKLACPNYTMFTEGAPCERCKGGRYFEAVKHHCLTSFAAGNVLAALEMGMTKAMQLYERTIHTFICPSRFLAEKMIAWGEPPSKMVVIPNAVEIPESIATRDGGYALAVGRLSVEKGFDVLVRAAATVPKIRIRIAGIGPEEGRLRSLATSLGATNVEFLGFVHRDRDRDLWCRARVVLTPSVWYENAPLAVLEAMAFGLPILASDIGGLPELVTHEDNGLLVAAHDVSAWAQALERFDKLPDETQARMGESSRQKIKASFTWEAHLTALEAVYRAAGAK